MSSKPGVGTKTTTRRIEQDEVCHGKELGFTRETGGVNTRPQHEKTNASVGSALMKTTHPLAGKIQIQDLMSDDVSGDVPTVPPIDVAHRACHDRLHECLH